MQITVYIPHDEHVPETDDIEIYEGHLTLEQILEIEKARFKTPPTYAICTCKQNGQINSYGLTFTNNENDKPRTINHRWMGRSGPFQSEGEEYTEEEDHAISNYSASYEYKTTKLHPIPTGD